MATIDIEVAGRRYLVACRDGEEEHLRGVAALVDARARDAAAAMGSLGETRQLLFAALLLADTVQGQTQDENATPLSPGDPTTAAAVEAMAARLEALADALEARDSSADRDLEESSPTA